MGIPLFALLLKRCKRGKTKDTNSAAKGKGKDAKNKKKDTGDAKGKKAGKNNKVTPAADDDEAVPEATAEPAGDKPEGANPSDAASAPASPPPSPPPADGSSSDGPDLDSIVQKKKRKQKLTAEEQSVYDTHSVIVDLIAEYERPLVKSVKQGLGNTFYEYNELALQYGYLVLFSMILPAAPVLALLNNVIEIRSDAFKTIYAQRRTRAEPADDIGPWARALKALAFAGLFCNLTLLLVTTDFFDEMAAVMPTFVHLGPRLLVVLAAEHALLLIKILIDFLVPDVPAKIRVRLAKEEHLAEGRVAEQSRQAVAAEGLVLEP